MKPVITEQERKRILTLYGIINEQTPLISPETENKRLEAESKEYPNYCLYPKFAKDPSSTPVQGGASGEDLYIDGYCLYAQPKERSVEFEASGIWLPNTGDTRIDFWNQDKREKFYKKYQDYLNGLPPVGKTKLSYDDIVEQVNNIYKDGLVYRFKKDGIMYRPAITYAPDYFRIAFAGFYIQGQPMSDKSKYKSPEWIDKRDDFQKFIDKYESEIGYAAMAIGIAISAAITGPFAIVFEIAFELGVGIPLAVRSFQKGENTQGLFNILGSLLPFLRLSKSFKGIKQETLDSLILKLQQKETRLINATSTSRAKNFYYGLTKEEKELLTKLLDEDRYGLWGVLKNMENPKYFEDIVVRDLKAVLEENPTVLGKKSFWKTILGKELKVTGGFMLTDIVYSYMFDWVLDAKDKEKLDGLELVIPENWKPDYYAMMTTKKKEDVEKLCENGQVEIATNVMVNSKQNTQAGIKMMNDLFSNPNIKYESKKPKIVKSSEPTLTVEELISQGYVNLLELEGNNYSVDTSVFFPSTMDIYVRLIKTQSDTTNKISTIKKESIILRKLL
jgi:hypothetical protein